MRLRYFNLFNDNALSDGKFPVYVLILTCSSDPSFFASASWVDTTEHAHLTVLFCCADPFGDQIFPLIFYYYGRVSYRDYFISATLSFERLFVC